QGAHGVVHLVVRTMTKTEVIFTIFAFVFVGMVLYFDIDRFLVMRFFGVVMSGVGTWVVVARRVPFAEDEDGENYFSGWVAVVAGVIVLALGIFAIVSPKWFMVFWQAVDGTPFNPPR